ncbi:MAG: hypothetical protein COA88_03050 [Kordia sp.]|nr:MAG: hypothetical protein COA88_03050 [Kordia sp.]
MVFWVLFIGGVLIYLFISTKKDEINKVNSEGGLEVKYRVLLKYFMEIPNVQIERKSSTSIILAIKDTHVVTRYTISHGFGNINVYWDHNSAMFGKHSLKWCFPEDYSQYLMLSTIEHEYEEYQKKLFKK